MKTLELVEQIISEINNIHLTFSKDYFETGKIDKINLSRTFKENLYQHIYKYRLTLHESINDYLMAAKIDIKYFYRVKTRESIDDKVVRYTTAVDKYPVNNWLNDIFGARIVLNADEIDEIMSHLYEWQEKYGLKNWYLREKEGYKGLHIYFKNKNNFYFPWELQIWDEVDVKQNITNHERFKRNFM